MLYLGIDQHARQITISLRDDQGDVLQARQVSTQPEKVRAFFTQLTQVFLREGESFLAVVEVCGFNDWLIRLLEEHHCQKVTWRAHMERDHLPPIREAPEEVPKLDRDQIIVRSYVGGLVKSFERKAA